METENQILIKGEFLLDDVFNVRGRGIVATGEVKSGVLKNGMKAEFEGIKTTIQSIERFNYIILEAKSGEQAGLYLSNINAEMLKRHKDNVVLFVSNDSVNSNKTSFGDNELTKAQTDKSKGILSKILNIFRN